MKLLKFILVCFTIIVSCDKDCSNGDSGCGYGQFIEENYSESAKYMLLENIYIDSLHPQRNEPFLNQDSIDETLDVIQAVYDLNIPEVDSIFNFYNITAFPTISYNNISISNFDEPSPELLALSAGQPTGDIDIDNLVTTLGFDSISVFHIPDVYLSVNLYTDLSLNTIAVEQMFNDLSVFQSVSINGAIGDGNRIELNRIGEEYRIDFSVGSGDCPSGCINRRHWIFDVAECEAEFVESYGVISLF